MNLYNCDMCLVVTLNHFCFITNIRTYVTFQVIITKQMCFSLFPFSGFVFLATELVELGKSVVQLWYRATVASSR